MCRRLVFMILWIMLCGSVVQAQDGWELTLETESDESVYVPQLGPYVTFISPTQARVSWWSEQACSARVQYGLAGPYAYQSLTITLEGEDIGDLESYSEQSEQTRHHSVLLQGLQPHELYAYRIDQSGQTSAVYQLDMTVNYARPAVLSEGVPDEALAAADMILNESQCPRRGYAVFWGADVPLLMQALASVSKLDVLALEQDSEPVEAARAELYGAGVYGQRLTVQQVDDMTDLSLGSDWANLIICPLLDNQSCPQGTAREMMRILRPQGVALLRQTPATEAWLQQDEVDFERVETGWGQVLCVTKSADEGGGTWTHQYADAGNTTDSGDDLGGATATDEMEVQWMGRPGADFGIDRNPRMPTPLAVNGRLFHQGMNRMVAVDAYNGSILWSLEIPDLRRVNLPRDAGNWCASDDTLYAAVRDRCWALDSQRGTLRRAYRMPVCDANESCEWGYLACQEGMLFGSVVRRDTIYTTFWGRDAWYDHTQGAGTGKVCSDAVFALDASSGETLWSYQQGVIINTTLAVSEGRVILVESRDEGLLQDTQRRLNDSRLWDHLYLVSLEATTGDVVWEQPLTVEPGIVVFFLACRPEGLVITSSANNQYHLYGFDPATGQARWEQSHDWPSDNHGGHMQHPVVMANQIFLEPRCYDLETGLRYDSVMGGREGCATYCGTQNALIYRGQSRRLAMWNYRTGEVTSWINLRPSCWLSTIAAEGMVLSPEGGGGCSCGNWIETSVAFRVSSSSQSGRTR